MATPLCDYILHCSHKHGRMARRQESVLKPHVLVSARRLRDVSSFRKRSTAHFPPSISPLPSGKGEGVRDRAPAWISGCSIEAAPEGVEIDAIEPVERTARALQAPALTSFSGEDKE